MAVFITCKNKNDYIKNKEVRVVKHTKSNRKSNEQELEKYSVVSNWIWPKFELLQAFIVGLVTREKGEDSYENEGAKKISIVLQL